MAGHRRTSAQEIVERGRRAALRVVEKMRIGVERDLRARVTEAFLDDLDRLAGLEEQRGVDVSEFVDGQAREVALGMGPR